jgi:hypothetical protein
MLGGSPVCPHGHGGRPLLGIERAKMRVDLAPLFGS